MWTDPYLETCCRSALHRLTLCDESGRPDGLKDGRCLARLDQLGFATLGEDGRYRISEVGRRRHATDRELTVG